jgi:hypothetical protein
MYNTHYNIIDTMRLAFGEERWKEICEFIVQMAEAHSVISAYISLYSRDRQINPADQMFYTRLLNEALNWDVLESSLGLMSNPVRYTLCELTLWAMMEGRSECGEPYGLIV